MVPVECISLDNFNVNVCDINIHQYQPTHTHTMHLHIATNTIKLVSKCESHYNSIINVYSVCAYFRICECRLNVCLSIILSLHLRRSPPSHALFNRLLDVVQIVSFYCQCILQIYFMHLLVNYK